MVYARRDRAQRLTPEMVVGVGSGIAAFVLFAVII